jgi:hypothetical protein
MEKKKISIAIENEFYASIRESTATPWEIFGEYIDNSIKSWQQYSINYKNYRDLNKLPKKPYEDQRSVSVTIKIVDAVTTEIEDGKKREVKARGRRRIEIFDNAWGIKEDDLPRAFSLAKKPGSSERGGISGEFGKGMKISSFWLANKWVVKTKVWGEELERQIEITLDNARGSNPSVDIQEHRAPREDHYTRIILTDLNDENPHNNTSGLYTKERIQKLQRMLSEIYSDFLETKTLVLTIEWLKEVDGKLEVISKEPMKSLDSTVRIWHDQIKVDESVVIHNSQRVYKWKKEFEIRMNDFTFTNEDGVETTPWAMATFWCLPKGARARAGLVLYRNRRAIKGMGDEPEDRFKPTQIYGASSSGSYLSLFLAGKVDLADGFSTSYSKNDIKFPEGLEVQLYERIKEQLMQVEDESWHDETKNICSELFRLKPETTKKRGKKSPKQTYEAVPVDVEIDAKLNTTSGQIKFFDTYPFNLLNAIKFIRWEDKNSEEGNAEGETKGETEGKGEEVIPPSPPLRGELEKIGEPQLFNVEYEGSKFYISLYKGKNMADGYSGTSWIEVSYDKEKSEMSPDGVNMYMSIVLNMDNPFFKRFNQHYRSLLKIACAYGIAKVKIIRDMQEEDMRDDVLDTFNTEFNTILTKVYGGTDDETEEENDDNDT